MGRIWLCGLLAAGLWWLTLHARFQREPLGMDCPAIQFSAARADAALGRVLGPQKPHPTGSAENDAVRARLLKELADMGVAARVQSGTSCFTWARFGHVACGAVNNVIAGVSPGSGRQVVLMAHYDSVAAGPGAGDDGSGVATLLETIRALKARGLTGEHPITALFTDGEESGLLGSQLFLDQPLRAAKTGVAINMEALGSSGPSTLFQVSAGHGPLVDLYARSVAHRSASSLYGEMYKYLPFDTDLTPVLKAGVTGMNFAFIGDVARYHTPLDRREFIPAATLQGHGDNALEMADALSRADFDALTGEDRVYLDVMGRWLPRLKVSLALPLSLVVLALIALAGFLTRRERREIQRPYTSFLMPPLLVGLAIGSGFVLHGLAAWISGNADPSLAHPVWLRLSLGFGAFAAALLTARGAGALAPWLWFAGLAVAASLWAPGAAPQFLFPAIIAAPLLLASAWGGRGPALLLAALAGMVVWIALAASGEQIMGLKLHPMFTAAAGFALVALLPVLGRARPQALMISFAASLVLALGFAVVAGLQPAFSSDAPQRLNLGYVESGGRGWWVADPVKKLPDALRAAANFSAQPQRQVEYGYVAPADRAHLTAPQARVTRDGDAVTLDVRSEGERFVIEVPRAAQIKALRVNGVAASPVPEGGFTFTCACRTANVALDMGSPDAVTLTLKSVWPGLASPDGVKLQKARPVWAVPSQTGDVSVSALTVSVPAR